MFSSRRIEKCPQSGWGCMGGGATDHHLEGNIHPVQLYHTVRTVRMIEENKMRITELHFFYPEESPFFIFLRMILYILYDISYHTYSTVGALVLGPEDQQSSCHFRPYCAQHGCQALSDAYLDAPAWTFSRQPPTAFLVESLPATSCSDSRGAASPLP